MSELSDKISKICTLYLGPAADIFLKRQTHMHMKGLEFDMVQQKDIPELLKWIQVSGQLVIKDKVNEMVDKLEKALK